MVEELTDRDNSEMPCGYDEDFVSPIDEDLQCSICYLPLREPVLSRCGHRFCRECLDRHIARFVTLLFFFSLKKKKSNNKPPLNWCSMDRELMFPSGQWFC